MIEEFVLLPVHPEMEFQNMKDQLLLDIEKTYPKVMDDITNNINGGKELLNTLIINLLLGVASEV